MECPNGHGLMIQGQKTWFCEECGIRQPRYPAPPEGPSARLAGLECLPSILAIPLHEFEEETHPVMRLHRLCDAIEILTRLFTIVSLAELRGRMGDAPLPEDLLRELQPQIERPTFGQWRNMLQAVSLAGRRSAPLVVPELPDFITRGLLPALTGGDSVRPEQSLIRLRNDLAHGGALTRAAAQGFLGTWEPWLENLTHQLSFLAEVDVCHFQEGIARSLIGPDHHAGSEQSLSADLRHALRDLDGHVILLRQECWLDLWPLCDYGRASIASPQGRRQASTESPQIYIRFQRDRLIYAALGVELPQSERTDVVAQFRGLFQLEARRPAPIEQVLDFEKEIRADSTAFVGRKAEIEHAKWVLKSVQSGVLWISGPGGMGKSYVLARLASDLGNAGGTWRIAWRFKVGDGVRCHRNAFFRHAIERIASGLGRSDVVPAKDPDALCSQLADLLDETAEHRVAKTGRAPRVLFVLDGLDEIERLDPSFPTVPFQLVRPNVAWLCAGRPERTLPQVFAVGHCTHVFPDGLPAMSDVDIRGMLIDRTGALKYDLLSMDREQTPPGSATTTVTNPAVQAVVDRAGGLPLFVHYVVQDILADHFRFDELERRLPPGLDAYYNDLLKRLSIGELQAILTPLVVTIACAAAPLEEETLLLLMVRRKVIREGSPGRALLQRAMAAIGSMVRSAQAPGGGEGFELYHFTFREHIREDRAGIIGEQNPLAREELCALVRGWQDVPVGHPARQYALRHGPRTLVEERRWDDLEALLTDLDFLEAKTEAGLVFDVSGDFDRALTILPATRSRSRILRLLHQALRYDLHFISRHPTTLFQCLWNRGWWYDSPGTAAHDNARVGGRPRAGLTWDRPGPERLSALLETWLASKKRRTPDFAWIRSLRPPPLAIGSGLLAVLVGHEKDALCVAWSPDRRSLASGSKDATVRIWDVTTGAELSVFRGHGRFVASVAWSPDGRLLASGSWDGSVRVWDVANNCELKCITGFADYVGSVAFSPDGCRLAGATSHAFSGAEVRIWDSGTWEELALIRDDRSSHLTVLFAPDGRLIIPGLPGRGVRVWEPGNDSKALSLDDLTEPRGSILGKDHNLVFASSAFYNFRGMLESISGPEASWIVDNNPGASLSPDLRLLAVPSANGSLEIWDMNVAGKPAKPAGATKRITSLVFSPDGQRLITGFSDGTISISALDSATETARITGLGCSIGPIVLSPGQRQFACGTGDHSIRIWDIESGREATRFIGHRGIARCLAFSPDGRWLASGSKDLSMRMWDVESGSELHWLRGHGGEVVSVAFSPVGRRLASGSTDRTIWLWDPRNGANLSRISGHRGAVTRLAFSPDGLRLVSGSKDETVRIWDPVAGTEILRLVGHRRHVTDVSFSRDGRQVISSSRDGTVRIWDGLTGECLEVFPGRSDISALAAGAAAYPWKVLARDSETSFEPAGGSKSKAWFPANLQNLATHPSGRIWAGSVDHVLYLVRLDVSGEQ